MSETALLAAQPPAAAPEKIRLVVWDLDEVFWHGTLTEGGITWRPELADIVRQLAARGVISSVCSKNDAGPVEAILAQHKMREYFVFPSISWEPKGPRLAALIEQIQLRPSTVLFIDDNPMNRAEAQHFAPGIQVADETILPGLLADPRLAGKDDRDLTRLKQYQVLERRAADQQAAGADTSDFLRTSHIRVTLEHDLEPHLDRAIELINRTNQLNFTKQRLPENIEGARGALRTLLSEHNISAGILRVRDRYGDYGYCGLYIMRSQRAQGRVLLQFAFSCRILGMGIESWLYHRLDKPKLKIAGPVLTDPPNDRRAIDWIELSLGADTETSIAAKPRIAYLLARGGCDMRAVSHYFGMLTRRVVEEFDTVRGGQTPMVNHSVIAAQSFAGFPDDFVRDCAPFGYLPEDFRTLIAAPPEDALAVWLLSFSIEQNAPLFRHKATGKLIPIAFPGLKGNPARLMRAPLERLEVRPELIAHLRARFDLVGPPPDDLFQTNLRAILSRAGAEVRPFILLANDSGTDSAGNSWTAEEFVHRNALISHVAAEFPRVELLRPQSFMTQAEAAAQKRRHHFDRMVYFRIFEHILSRI